MNEQVNQIVMNADLAEMSMILESSLDIKEGE